MGRNGEHQASCETEGNTVRSGLGFQDLVRWLGKGDAVNQEDGEGVSEPKDEESGHGQQQVLG